MILHLSTSGGIGGFGLGREAQVDVEALDDDALRAEVCAALAPDRLQAYAASAARRGADRVSHRIAVERADGGVEVYQIDEGALPAEMLDMLDALYAAAKAQK